MAVSPAIGVAVGRAAALIEAAGAMAALVALDHIEAAAIAAYQPYWAERAEALRRSGDLEAAVPA